MTETEVSSTTLTNEYRHLPVMLSEVLTELSVQKTDIVCDCTLGGAGHSLELAKHLGQDGLLIGIDQDDRALDAAKQRFSDERRKASLICEEAFLKGNFSELDNLLLKLGIAGVDCFLFDLGVSSPQLDWAHRGFSYKLEAPLDMRMDPSTNPLTAAEVVNTTNEADLTRILRLFGEERFASSIARAICKRRSLRAIRTTCDLAELVKEAIPAAARRKGTHPARKTFQALRIEVNHELDVLQKGLEAACRWLLPGGRLCVISYHSLEDKIVKHLFSEYSRSCICPDDLPICTCKQLPILTVKNKRAIVASPEELANNPRARSAKLRCAQKTKLIP